MTNKINVIDSQPDIDDILREIEGAKLNAYQRQKSKISARRQVDEYLADKALREQILDIEFM